QFTGTIYPNSILHGGRQAWWWPRQAGNLPAVRSGTIPVGGPDALHSPAGPAALLPRVCSRTPVGMCGRRVDRVVVRGGGRQACCVCLQGVVRKRGLPAVPGDRGRGVRAGLSRPPD